MAVTTLAEDLPANMLSERAKVVWRIRGGLSATLMLAAFGLLAVVLPSTLHKLAWTIWYALAFALVILLVVYPSMYYRRWRWELFENELKLVHGFLYQFHSTIPLVRIQYVNTVSGPVQRAFGLSSVKICTAARMWTIPLLEDSQAQALHEHMSLAARAADDGGL